MQCIQCHSEYLRTSLLQVYSKFVFNQISSSDDEYDTSPKSEVLDSGDATFGEANFDTFGGGGFIGDISFDKMFLETSSSDEYWEVSKALIGNSS